MKEHLTPKQKRFCEEYLLTLNSTAAAVQAGYKPLNAKKTAYRLLQENGIQAYIAVLRRERSERTQIRADQVLRELACIGFANITDFMKIADPPLEVGKDEAQKPVRSAAQTVEVFSTDQLSPNKLAAIAEIRRSREGITLKLHDKVKALELLGKHLGIFEKDNNQRQSKRKEESQFDLSQLTHEQLAALEALARTQSHPGGALPA